MSVRNSARDMHYVRLGHGKPLLLLHGLGGSWRSWSTITNTLAASRQVVAVDLPGFGGTPPLGGDVSISALADAVGFFLALHNLLGIDVVGSSMGARLALELARRGVTGNTVALAPGGFWKGWERRFFYTSIAASIRLVRALQPVMPSIARSSTGRTALLPQLSPKPWALPSETVLDEMRSYAAARSFDPLLKSLAYGPAQEGAPAGTLRGRLAIGWGTQDRVCLPRQAARAQAAFPDAELHWFSDAGHFPHWDQPAGTVRLILDTTA